VWDVFILHLTSTQTAIKQKQPFQQGILFCGRVWRG